MPVYTNKIEIEITMDAECASTAHSIAARCADDAAARIKKRIDDANPGLPEVEIGVRCEYRGEDG